MKASEAIEKLTWMIEAFGDCELTQQLPMYYAPAEKYYLHVKPVNDIHCHCSYENDDMENMPEIREFHFS